MKWLMLSLVILFTVGCQSTSSGSHGDDDQQYMSKKGCSS